MTLLPHQRQYAEAKFRFMIAESSGNEFERLFHRLMELCHADYVPIRTHGNIGDLGADGLALADRCLYACYGPEVGEPGAVRKKFRDDLESAVYQRPEQFDTFVFVHNDHRGVQPVVSGLLAAAKSDYPRLSFAQMGARKLWDKAMRLDLLAMEQLLGGPIPIQEVAYEVGMADVEDLLRHLAERREDLGDTPAPVTNLHKAEYNNLDQASRDTFQWARRYLHFVTDYYHGDISITERDEVAQSFRSYYELLRDQYGNDTEEIVWQLHTWVGGQARSSVARANAVNAVLVYFFDQCDIFEVPPADWQPAASEARASS